MHSGFERIVVKTMLVFAALWGATLGIAQAAGERAALDNTIVMEFNADDRALMKDRIGKALAAEPDSETLAWKNEATGASGSVAPLERLVWNGLPCRHLRIVNSHGRRTAQGVYRFCEKPAGQWKLAGPVAAKP